MESELEPVETSPGEAKQALKSEGGKFDSGSGVITYLLSKREAVAEVELVTKDYESVTVTVGNTVIVSIILNP